MNWGSKIAIVFVGFVVLVTTMVTICMKQNDIHLVTEKYYEKEIAYQEQIDIERNAASLAEKPSLKYVEKTQTLLFNYPDLFSGDVSGTIIFFRPADANKDFTIPIKLGTNRQQMVSASGLDKGLWKIKMEWSKSGKTYYQEEKLVIQ